MEVVLAEEGVDENATRMEAAIVHHIVSCGGECLCQGRHCETQRPPLSKDGPKFTTDIWHSMTEVRREAISLVKHGILTKAGAIRLEKEIGEQNMLPEDCFDEACGGPMTREEFHEALQRVKFGAMDFIKPSDDC